MSRRLSILLYFAATLAAGALISAGLFAMRSLSDDAPIFTYTPFIHSGTLIEHKEGALIVTGAYPGSPKDTAPLSMRYGRSTKFLRHDPKTEDGHWVGVDVRPEDPQNLKAGDYLYITYIYDAENRFLATEIIVGNPLIQ